MTAVSPNLHGEFSLDLRTGSGGLRKSSRPKKSSKRRLPRVTTQRSKRPLPRRPQAAPGPGARGARRRGVPGARPCLCAGAG